MYALKGGHFLSILYLLFFSGLTKITRFGSRCFSSLAFTFLGARMDKKKIFMVSLGHLSCDVNSGALPAILPYLITRYGFNYQAAAGLMFAFSMLSSIIQPVFGYLADRIGKPWYIPLGVLLAGTGLALVGFLDSYWAIFAAVMLCGTGGALFHPEGARYANKVSGTAKGTGLSIFSIGGNAGFVVGPLLAVGVLNVFGLPGTAVFGVLAVFTSGALLYLVTHMKTPPVSEALSGSEAGSAGSAGSAASAPPGRNNWTEFSKLTAIIMSRSILFMGFNTFIPLYWVHVFGQSKSAGALALACFCTFGVLWNLAGGMLSDRVGYVRLLRMVYPFTLPSVALFALTDNELYAFALLVPLSFGLYAGMSSTVVLGQKYLARNIGFASGVTLGLATSVGGIVAPVLGWAGDVYGLRMAIMSLCGVALVGILFTFILKVQPSQTSSLAVDSPQGNE